MAKRGEEFAGLAYTILVIEKRFTVEDVASAIGVSYAALHARLVNRTSFSADEIRRFIAAVPDARLVGYLLEGTNYIAADRVEADGLPLVINRGAARVVIEAADVLKSVDMALADDWIDHREGRLILREIEQAERALASLRVSIETLPCRRHDGDPSSL